MQDTGAMGKRLVFIALLALTACGGGPGPSSSPGHTAASGSAAPSASASATPIPVHKAAWVIPSAGGPTIRIGQLPSGPFHTVATLPVGSDVVAASGNYAVLVDGNTGHLESLNLTSGHTTDYGGAAGTMYWGGAFNPDSSKFMYVRSASPTDASLNILTLASGSISVLHTFTSNTYDAPMVWTASAVGTFDLVGFADAGLVGMGRLNPATGTRTAHSSISNGSGPVVAGDALHAAAAVHSELGDDADSPGGPGPGRPLNTLLTFTIGNTPNPVLQEPHHDITPLAANGNGSKLLFYDNSSAGGFAGISQSPDFGLILWNGVSKTQISPYGETWDSAVFIDSTSFLAAKDDGTTTTLVRGNGTSLTTLDAQPGTGSAVFLLS